MGTRSGSVNPAPGSGGVGQPDGQVILVVDDEAAVRLLMVAALEGAGYRTLDACCGLEALRVAEAHQGRVHLLLTDIIMPGMDGWELARRLSAVQTGLKVIYTSGTESAPPANDAPEPDAFLIKPFTPGGLLQAVGAALQPPLCKPAGSQD